MEKSGSNLPSPPKLRDVKEGVDLTFIPRIFEQILKLFRGKQNDE